jgi:RNA polymerase sigma factor (sigma-70 family)
MRRIGFSSEGMVRSATSSSQNDPHVPGFEELAMPLFDSLYNFASWLVHNNSNAEDLVQESYLKALRSFASFQPGTNFRAWMFRILRNAFLSSRTTLDRRLTVEIEAEDDVPMLTATSTTPESLLMERFQQNALRNAIEQLPVAFREVLLLCDVEDASYREISEILSIPLGTVMSRLARARKAVRKSLLSSPYAPLSEGRPHYAATREKAGDLAGEKNLR